MNQAHTTQGERENGWLRKIAENPGHSAWYIQRFRDLAARGEDLAGEARLIDAMAPRAAGSSSASVPVAAMSSRSSAPTPQPPASRRICC